MTYNFKQYDAARDFTTTSVNSSFINNVDNVYDKLRLQVYDLYEDIYINSTYNLKIILRGEDQSPILLPTGKKLIEAVNRFLGLNVDYLVQGQGDAGVQQALDIWFQDFFDREKFKTKFESGKRWGLIRGDSVWYIYADSRKDAGTRISIAEIDPRQVFEIEDIQGALCGYHIVDLVRDWREPDEVKFVTRRRTFRKDVDEDGQVIKNSHVTSELTYWELNSWDDREPENELEYIPGGAGEHEPIILGTKEAPITAFPIYKWNNAPMQNTNWGTSQLAGMETLLYALNQSITDEDATIVFQGLGMYVTTAAPPIDPNTGAVCDWNIGPMQIIEIGQDQKFDRVSGITDVSPYQNHMNFIDEKGLSESTGIPEVAIGRVDPQAVQSGIALKLELMPLLAQNSEKELSFINLLDQMFNDIVKMWLPAYEIETFGNYAVMQECKVVCLFDNPMPVDRDATINETVTLVTNNLILTSMAVRKLRDLGWQYPTVDPYTGEPLDDEDIADMLMQQAQDNMGIATGGGTSGADQFGANQNPNDQSQNGQGNPNAQTVSLGQ